MKAVILAGGLGTRLSEETDIKPKPMVEIGGKPILWHIMKIYSSYGINEFVVCCGYKGYVIKEFFSNYALHTSDVTFDLGDNSVSIHKNRSEDWKVTLVDTGHSVMTGGRLKRIQHLVNDDDFCFTYGDGVADIDLAKLIAFHNEHGRLATVTAVMPPGRFGAIVTDDTGMVTRFAEKPKGDNSMVNGGFFILNPKIFDYIDGDEISWEDAPLEKLASEGQLKAFQHEGFWQPMDTLRDKNQLEDMWLKRKAPWKTW